MSSALWVSMPIIRNIILASSRNTEDIQNICKVGGITPAEMEDSSYQLSLDQNCAIMEAALSISGDPALGLHIGEITTPSVLGITGHLVLSSKTVGAALSNLQEFTRAFTKLYTFRLQEYGDEAHYYCEPLEIWNDMSPDTARHSVDIAFAAALHILRLLTGKVFHPRKVIYRYPRIRDTSEHEKILKCRPEFNREANCIIFSRTDMEVPVIGYNEDLSKVFKELLHAEISKHTEGATISSEIRRLILTHFQFTFPQLEDLASLMNMTTRTLQRKLQEENTTFRILTDQLKKEMASNLLKNDSLSVADIAFKLGYAEPGTFQRAFRQWTGQTPYSFRLKT